MVRNSDAVAAGGGHCNAVVVAVVDADISCFQESNEMAAAAYDSSGIDQKLQEDNAILAAVAWSLLDEEDCIRAGVDPDEVADGRSSEDTSLGAQYECRAADHLPWKDAHLSGHQNLESSYVNEEQEYYWQSNRYNQYNTNGNNAINRVQRLVRWWINSVVCRDGVTEASAACFSRKISPKNDSGYRNEKEKEAKLGRAFQDCRDCPPGSLDPSFLPGRSECEERHAPIPSGAWLSDKNCSAAVKTCNMHQAKQSQNMPINAQQHPSPTLYQPSVIVRS